mgnify:FL=1
MGWLRDRKAKKTLSNLGMSDSDIDELTSTLKQGHQDAINMRNELRKKESKTYKKLIKQINNISYEPLPAQEKYDRSLALIHEASLSEWERDDLLTQTEDIYGEILKARPYLQVLSMLNHIKSDNVTRIQKIDSSLKLIKNSDLTQSEEEELTEQVKKVYKF